MRCRRSSRRLYAGRARARNASRRCRRLRTTIQTDSVDVAAATPACSRAARSPSSRPYPANSSHRRGVVVSGVRRMNEVNARRARLVPLWVTVFGPSGGYTVTVCNKPTKTTQPCIPPGSLNQVPASAGVRAGMSPLPGGR